MFIFDNIILAPAFGHGVATWRGALFDRKKKVLYRYLMYGSQKNLQVYGDGFLPKVPIAGSSKEEFFYALYEACKCSLDKDEEINEAVYKEHKNLRYLYCDLASLKLNEWQLIEWFFYDREVGTSFSTGTSFYEFLARADYRQTITRDYYEEYVQNSKYFKQYFKKGHRAGLRNPYWHVPDETEAIVYVYGSPIFVEKKPLSQLVHNINDRSYLYLSKKDIQKLRSYTLNNVSFLRLISKALIENGLIKEEQSMRNELLFEDEANKMKDQELMEYVSKYVTNVKPL